jgi:hypothetical protein
LIQEEFMRKKGLLVASLIGVVMLTGCGASFSISASDLEKYSEDNSAVYADMSDSYTDTYDYLDGLYVMEKDDVHVELRDLDTTQNASKWFESNVEDIKEGSKSSSGSSTSSGGSYTISTDDMVYRILFSEDKGIYAYGDTKDSVNKVLADLNIN